MRIKKLRSDQLRKTLLLFVSVFILSMLWNTLSTPKVKIPRRIKHKLENTLYLDLDNGSRITIQMYPEFAPICVKKIKSLVRSGFYNSMPFDRVVGGYIAQCSGKETKSSAKQNSIVPEVSKLPHIRGSVSSIRQENDENPANGFFVTMLEAPFLNNNKKYTVWGYVINGMKHVENLNIGKHEDDGIVKNPNLIISAYIAIDKEIQDTILNYKKTKQP